MPNKRDLNLDEYNIGKNAYRELRYFCLRYPEMKKQLAELRSPYSSPRASGMPHRSSTGDPTARSAERAAELSRSCEMIEQAAIEAGEQDYPYLLLAVTQEDVSWSYLRMRRGLRTYEKGFRKKIRHFYYSLARKKKII